MTEMSQGKSGRLVRACAAASVVAGAAAVADAESITIFHYTDPESQLVNAGDGNPAFGGIGRFVALLNQQRAAASGAGRTPFTFSAGDNFLAGPEFNASQELGTIFDAQALNAVNPDASAIGNHEFDFGPQFTADFINATSPGIPFVSANLDFSGFQPLQDLVDSGKIVKSTVVDKGGVQVGVVGATTPQLPTISSPGAVKADPVVAAVQAEIDALQAAGVNKIIFVSHLQSVNNDIEIVQQLNGVDVAIAGGGDDLLANAGPLFPGDTLDPARPYPIVTTADGKDIPIVTTPGDYRYLGKLEVEFDADGNVTSFNGNPLVVVDSSVGGEFVGVGVDPDPSVQSQIAAPVAEFLEQLDQTVVGQAKVDLNGVRADIRTKETNQGNLIADAFLAKGQDLADDFGVDPPMVALVNGGGIRNDSVLPAGSDITLGDTFDISPFANFLAVIEDMPASTFKQALENAVSQVEDVAGRFAQVAGFSFAWNPDLEAGNRVIEITLDDGMQIVADGQVVADLDLDVIMPNFIANGGDGYAMFEDLDFTALGLTDQQALAMFIADNLNGMVTAEAYAAGGEGRITTTDAVPVESPSQVIPTPSAALAGLLLLGGLAVRRGRRA